MVSDACAKWSKVYLLIRLLGDFGIFAFALVDYVRRQGVEVHVAAWRPGKDSDDSDTFMDSCAICLVGPVSDQCKLLVTSTTGEEADYQSARPGKVWWAYARWVYAWIVLTLVVGIYLSTSVYHFAVQMKYPDIPTTPYNIPGISGDFSWQSSDYVGHWLLNPLYISFFILGIALARMAKASNATPGRCTAPLNSTVRSRKADLPSEVTELGSVVN